MNRAIIKIRHFLYFLPTIPAALPPENSTELEIFLPAFATQDFLSVPRGTSQASDSVALAVFSLASIHLAYLHRSSALDRLLISRPDLAAVSISLHQRYTSTATALQQASLALARAGLLIEASQIAEPSATTKRHLDYLAFATNLCVFSHVLAGGTGFRAALDLSHAIANARGGPRGLLEGARQTGDLRTLRRMRATLENDVAWEVFSTCPVPSSVEARLMYASPRFILQWEVARAVLRTHFIVVLLQGVPADEPDGRHSRIKRRLVGNASVIQPPPSFVSSF